MSSFQQKNYEAYQETRKCDPIDWKKEAGEVAFERTKMSDLADKDVKTTIINIFKELKKILL